MSSIVSLFSASQFDARIYVTRAPHNSCARGVCVRVELRRVEAAQRANDRIVAQHFRNVAQGCGRIDRQSATAAG
eukprot:6288278-Lingulodinium_polyedra.AAC.1